MRVGGTPPFPAYVLAGGRSRRFGSDKARATVEGVPLVVRVVRRLQLRAPSVHVIADRPDRYADLDLPTLGDLEPGRGPLGGLATALRHASSPWIWIASCDLLDLRPRWLDRLEAARSGAGSAVAFRGPSGEGGASGEDRAGRWQPFPALYRTSLEDEVRRRLAAGRVRMQDLLDDAARSVDLPDDWPDPAQANTPADLEAFRSLIRRSSPEADPPAGSRRDTPGAGPTPPPDPPPRGR